MGRMQWGLCLLCWRVWALEVLSALVRSPQPWSSLSSTTYLTEWLLTRYITALSLGSSSTKWGSQVQWGSNAVRQEEWPAQRLEQGNWQMNPCPHSSSHPRKTWTPAMQKPPQKRLCTQNKDTGTAFACFLCFFDPNSFREYGLLACLFVQLCPTLWHSMDYSPPGSSIHGIFQARILEWVAISFSKGSSPPQDGTRVPWIAGGFFTSWANRKALRQY